MFILALGSLFASIYSHSETNDASQADGSVELGLVVKCPQQSWFSFIEELNYLSHVPCHLIVSPLFLALKAHKPKTLFFSSKFQKDIFSLERNKQRWPCNLASLKNKNVFLHHCRPCRVQSTSK